MSSFEALEIIRIHPFHTFCKEPREERLCCHNWHIKAQATWHENILQDESAGHVGCVCHGTLAKWLLMDMTASWPCWKKPQSVASLQVMVWVKPVGCYRKFGILFLEYVVLVANFLQLLFFFSFVNVYRFPEFLYYNILETSEEGPYYPNIKYYIWVEPNMSSINF